MRRAAASFVILLLLSSAAMAGGCEKGDVRLRVDSLAKDSIGKLYAYTIEETINNQRGLCTTNDETEAGIVIDLISSPIDKQNSAISVVFRSARNPRIGLPFYVDHVIVVVSQENIEDNVGKLLKMLGDDLGQVAKILKSTQATEQPVNNN